MITRLSGRSVAALAATGLGLLALSLPAAADHDGGPKPTVVLVHGAWADAASWAGVTERLQKRGYTVLAAPNPLRGLGKDASSVAAFVAQRTTGPVVLVGHSYGGAVVTNAAASDRDVKALVYVNAFVPDEGETVLGLQGGGDPSALFDTVTYPGAPAGDVDLYVKTVIFPRVFAADLPARTAARLAASQRPIALSALLEPSGTPAWKKLPSWYLVGTADGILAPALQRTMARRAHSRITETTASHLSMLSAPAAVVEAVTAAARSTS